MIDLKGATAHVRQPSIPGVIEQAKNMFLQTNPRLRRI